MKFNLLNQIGDWNPQLLRELKGRWKQRNVLLAVAISLIGQFLLFMNFQIQLPISDLISTEETNRYCVGSVTYGYPKCLKDGFGNIIINWDLWSLDIFTWLSVIACFTLLVAGSYLLISDLANEERRATLNFIRLSPQTPQRILLGKMLGVPILLYLVVSLALPLHLWSGLSAKVPLVLILGFYAAVIAVGFFYYSAALLFGLVGSWLGGFQAWLGSGAVLSFLLLSQKPNILEEFDHYPVFVFKLFNPSNLIPYSSLFDFSKSAELPSFHFQWFALPLGDSFIATVGFTLLVNSLGAYCIWQSLQRGFRDANATMLSKQQSYLLTSGFTLLTIGCANWQELVFKQSPRAQLLSENVACLFLLNFGLFLYLIAAISPHYQTLQDWARYRKVSTSQKRNYGVLFQDLIWGEKSPGLLAIAINAIIAMTGLGILISLSHVEFETQVYAFFGSALTGSLAILYAAIAQLILGTKHRHRIVWTVGIIGGVIVLPIIVIAMFSSYSSRSLWLFTIAAPILAVSPDGKSLSFTSLFVATLGYLAVAGLLIFQLRRNLKKAGESATKALLAQG